MPADKRMGRGPRLRIRPTVEALEGRDLLSSGGGWTAHASLSAAWVAVVKGKAGASLGSYAGAMPRSGLVSAAGAGDDTARTSHGRPTFVAGPLVTVSDPSLTPAVRDQGPLGTLYVGSSVEPQLAVDPRAPRHLVAVWQQDRWSNEGARAIDSSVSIDGGVTWSKPAVVPGLMLSPRGPYARISDPWVAFSRDGSTVYISALPFATFTNIDASGVTVSRFTDGGRTWRPPPATLAALPDGSPPLLKDVVTQTDKDMIVTDPVHPNIVYAVWNEQAIPDKPPPFTAVTTFSRSTDGGRTWEAPRTIYNPGLNASATNQRLLVRPDGTIYNVFSDFHVNVSSSGRFQFNTRLSIQRSPDRGQTWGTPIPGPSLQGAPVVDPNTGAPVRTPSTPSGLPVQWADVTMDPRTGTLYAVWQDATLNPAPIDPSHNLDADRIAFAESTDGGVTWSAPIRVNQTPSTLRAVDQQAFLPAVQVSADGTIAVSYYDFRMNNPAANKGVGTDAWIVFCRPGADPTNPASWGSEVRLTDISFNLEKAPVTTGGLTGGGYFLGDYTALKAVGREFVATFVVTSNTGLTSVVFRRVSPARRAGHVC